MRTITVKVRRSSKGEDSYIQEYQVNVDEEKDISVMNILEDIYNNQDDSLAFFSHAACRQAACGKCMVKIDGKTKLACKEKVETDSILIEPYNNRVIKDLVCK